MYPHRKPLNLFIVAYEGVDFVGKTTTFNGVKYKVIYQGFLQQTSKQTVNQLVDKYEVPLQTEGTPLFDDYNSLFLMQLRNTEQVLNDLVEESKQDFYVSHNIDSSIKLFLTLPHKLTPSYLNLKKIFQSDENAPKRIESRFKAFVINYHESMQYVWSYLKYKPKSQQYLLYTDRSWISNFVYNGYTGDIENDEILEKKIKQAGYHNLDFVTLFTIDRTTLRDRLQAREQLSFYEKYGVERLLKMQDKYIYLVKKLHDLGFVKEYNVINHNLADVYSK